MELNYPRFIHAEVKTHRVVSKTTDQYELVLTQNVDLMDDPMLSRNASSSRAIPIEKMMGQVLDNPALPVSWGENKPGMQAGIQLDSWGVSTCKNIWNNASLNAVRSTKHLAEQGLHKQVANRLLEPFQWIKVIVTATEWDNFFKLRLHPDAQPEIQELARCMKKAIEESTPIELKPGEWHLPYTNDYMYDKPKASHISNLIKCSVARCARVSYNNHDNSSPNIEKDIALADKLLEAGHMSPFEHQATPMSDTKVGFWCDHQNGWGFEEGCTHIDTNGNYWSGNFRGFLQYRQLVNN